MSFLPSPLEGHLVRLRARELEDEAAFQAWFNDYAVTEFLAVRYPIAHAAERNLLEGEPAMSHRRAAFSVETLGDRLLIGNCELRVPAPENRCGNLGIAIGHAGYRDRGYGTDTMRTLCRFGFAMMNLHRIELTVDATNARARHVYRKVGFVEECLLRDHRFIAGSYRDTVVMSILRNELQEVLP
jgi:RimJ/RimL family protein N-acetyltransferase